MSKELEALKIVKYNSSKEVVEAFDVIEKSLQRLEAIDNANPSKVLKCFERITAYFLNKTKEIDFQDLRDIEQALIKAQENENKIDNLEYEKKMLIKESVRDIKIIEKQHKVLEIIKKKPPQSRIAIAYLETSITPTYEDYSFVIKTDLLSEDEFELLKMYIRQE